jgi:hypothetical protein
LLLPPGDFQCAAEARFGSLLVGRTKVLPQLTIELMQLGFVVMAAGGSGALAFRRALSYSLAMICR